MMAVRAWLLNVLNPLQEMQCWFWSDETVGCLPPPWFYSPLGETNNGAPRRPSLSEELPCLLMEQVALTITIRLSFDGGDLQDKLGDHQQMEKMRFVR
jgi:hypothetical protein